MRCVVGGPSHVLPSSQAIDRASAAPPDACPGFEREGTGRGLRHALFGAVRGPLAAEVVATLLDEDVYLCSERTMYRVLASEVPVQERRAQRSHPEYQKPELMATGPNQVWSWDITRLLGPKKWSYFYLYVIMDIYTRYVVGWMVADRENSALAGRLIQQSCLKHGVQPQVLTLHSDRGAPMTSQCTAQLLADLGVTRSLSRPQVSDDNPFSEAQFKTLKYHPSFPGRFGRPDPGQDLLSLVLPLVQCRAPPWRHLHADSRTGPLRSGRSDHRPQGGRAPHGLGSSSRPLRLRSAEAKTTPGGRLDQSSHPIPHHTGNCSLINPEECLTIVDRFRNHLRSGRCERCMIVPAVTVNW